MTCKYNFYTCQNTSMCDTCDDGDNYENYSKGMRHGSLFSGIGGFDLAAEWMGWENVFHCELMEFPRKVLDFYWPDADSHIDICKTDFTKYANKIDIITGGFPCQPFSTAGKRKGKEDERHLWPEMLRVIREVQPSYVVGENVYGLLNWNGGLVFDEVHADLAAEGYETQAVVIPAAAVNAPHGRDRVWFVAKYVANADSNGQHGSNGEHEKQSSQRREYAQRNIKQVGGNAADTEKIGIQRNWTKRQQISSTHESKKISMRGNRRNHWEQFPTQSPICGGDDGLPCELDGITFPKWRNESIRAYGNAIVPQVAYSIFKTIEQTKYENY